MSFLCSVCRTKYKKPVNACDKCGSHKFTEQKYDMLLPSGQIISGRYRIINFLKSGGMGAVYMAEDMHLSRFCAIKELINPSIDDEDYKLAFIRFDREAKMLSNLVHPGLPRVIDYFSSEKRHYIVMDYIDGEDLETILNERYSQGFPEEDVIKWSLQICDVLTYLHTQNPPVIYRDIKPSNIMIRKSDKKIILVDFGIARTLVSDTHQICTITSVGTMGYMSPEQYRGKPDKRSDIYSLGACMYHLLTGKAPLPFTLEPFEDIRHDLSSHIKSILSRSVRMKISERFQSAMEMKEALLGNLQLEPVIKKDMKELDLLLDQLSSDDPDMRYMILRTLKNYKEESSILEPLLAIALNDPDLIVRREACEFSSDFEDKKILVAFNKLMSDRDIEIRQTAIKVLEKFKEVSSCEVLIHALSDKDINISTKAAMCLLKMREKKYLPEIFDFLKKQTCPDIQHELEEAIHNVDPSYLNSWRKEKSEKDKKTEKKYRKILIYIFISVIITTVIIQVYMKVSASVKYNRLMNKGEKYLDDYDYYPALECFSEAITIKADEPKSLYCFGRTYIPLDQNKARFYLNKALDLKKDYPEALMAEGKLYLVENNYKEAIKYLEKSIKLKDDLPLSYIYLGEAFYKSGDKIKAEEIFSRALLSEDNSAVISGWLKKIKSEKISKDEKQKIKLLLEEGKQYMDNRNYPAAGTVFMEIININPEDSRGYTGTGRVILLRENFDMSLQYFHKAIECDPVSKEAFCNIGFIYIQKGDYSQAITYLNRAIDIDPFHSKVRYLSGLAYKNEGKEEEAMKEFNIYLNLSPSGEYAGEIKKIMKIMEKK